MNNDNLNNEWRRVAAAIYRKPVDAKILGSVEIDVTDLERFIAAKRKQGIKITPTHVFTLAVARGLKYEVPELNCYISRGRLVKRDHIDAMISVVIRDGQMSSVKIPDADTLTLEEMTEILNEGVRAARSGEERKVMRSKGLISRVPWPFRGWLLRLAKTISIDWGISIPSLGLSKNSFGSFVVSNIGSLGLDTGYPALFPLSNVSFVMILGGIYKKPVVINDEIVPRRVITLSMALDHRVVDALQGGKLFRHIKNVVRNPETLDEKPWF